MKKWNDFSVDTMPAITPARITSRHRQFMWNPAISFNLATKLRLKNGTGFHIAAYLCSDPALLSGSEITQMPVKTTIAIMCNHTVTIFISMIILLDGWDRGYADHVRTFTAYTNIACHEISQYAHSHCGTVRWHT